MPSFKFIKCKADGTREHYLAAWSESNNVVGIVLYRESGPAIIHKDGTEEFYTNGRKHRVGEPAVINPNTGYQEFWTNGELGRKEGPAIIYPDGGKDWLWKNLYHRGDGPAREFADGSKQYFYEGKIFEAKDDKEFMRKVKLINLY